MTKPNPKPSVDTVDSFDTVDEVKADMEKSSDPHPSEFMHFSTVPQGFSDHREYASFQRASLREPMSPMSPPVSPSTAQTKQRIAQESHQVHRDLINTVPDFQNLAREARRATASEHSMGFLKAIRTYPKAIGWSILLSLTIVMEGFDITLVSSFYAFPQFKKAFGERVPGTTDFEISTEWQSSLTVGAVVGEVIGLLFNGPLIDHFGNRRTMIVSLLALCGFIFLSFFATNIQMLLASQILSGIPWGIFQTLSTTYAAEVMPVALRAYLTSNVNLCWVIGQLIASGMLRGLINNDSEWSYRIPFSLQWMWALPILIGVVFAPESPWWLIRHGKEDEARRSLRRLTKSGEGFQLDETISMMRHTNEVEKYMGAGTSYRDCFRGPDLRRTEICCVVWMTQAVSAIITGNAAYFYEQAGLSADRAFDMSVGMYVAGIVGAVLSWFLMRVVGRRSLYLWGTGLCGTTLLIAGVVGAAVADAAVPNSPQSWALSSMIVINTLLYDSTIGPVCYSLVAEVPSTRLRVKTVVLARICYNLLVIVANVLVPKMLNPTAWNWKGKSCFLWGALTLACWVWCFFRLPEPKGLTYMELDILFEKKATARQFGMLRSKLTESGYFSLVSKEDGKGGRDEWHENRM